MSSFGFINDSKPNNNRTFIAGKYPKKNKYSKSLQQSVQALKKLPSNDEESSENQTQFDSSDDGGRSTSSPNKEAFLRSNSTVKQNFKSPFSFLNQYDEKNQASHVAKHPPLKFTSSFIIEDYIDNDYHPSSTRADKSGKKEDISSYFSLLDSYPAAFLDKKPSISNKSNDKLLQSASNDSLSVLQSEGRSPMINSAFDFINHGEENRVHS
ncbi:hypothetical protein BD408DRAFT_228942 [Parasitella parasitica]|nr:hypothetical protein BD408DRAFT_228942 [Parasitella parasitica]